MDDGSYFKTKNQLIICTDSYSKEDVLRLISVLSTKFNLSAGLIIIKKKIIFLLLYLHSLRQIINFIIEYELINHRYQL